MFRDVFSITLLVGVLALAPLGATSPYFLITPGGTYDVNTRVQVPDDVRKPAGRLAFTAVYEQEASWAEIAHAKLFGQAEWVPAAEVRPPGETQQQVNETNKKLIDESKPVAAVVALRTAGYDVQITGQGAEVESVIDGMPAQGVLQQGDIIVAVDGQPVDTTTALIADVSRRSIGETLTLTVKRADQLLNLQVGTRASPTDPGRPIVGVTVSTYAYDVRLPFPVDVQSDDVGGPSAGLMFALGILDAVTDGDLTRGYFVAGTGTLAPDGSVGPIGGAAEKALAAEDAGAQVFIVPRDNADEARRWVHSLQIVPVGTFDEAVHALCALSPLPTAASPDPPTPCTSLTGP